MLPCRHTSFPEFLFSLVKASCWLCGSMLLTYEWLANPFLLSASRFFFPMLRAWLRILCQQRERSLINQRLSRLFSCNGWTVQASESALSVNLDFTRIFSFHPKARESR